MGLQDFYNLIDIPLFSFITGLLIFAFLAGYSVGATLGFVRKVTYQAT